jgi:hypothetical protein
MRLAMTSRFRDERRNRAARCCVAWLAVVPADAFAAPDVNELIAGLARPPPAAIAFTEVRLSTLLAMPLVVSGTLEYAGAETLQRRVESPYRETTTLGGESVRVEREGEPPRTFALRRAPELRGLLSGMTGLLRGDVAALSADFDIAATGDGAGWRLDMTPKNARLRERLDAIVVLGQGAEPQCYALQDGGGGASVMLLGTIASQPLPEPLALPELLEHCGAE